jgi:hypothetical protein
MTDKTTTTETVKIEPEVMTLKNFKNNSDIENFYRFIHENKLRGEAHTLMELVLKSIQKASKKKAKNLQ